MIGILTGLLSGFLWGVNNLLISLGYTHIPFAIMNREDSLLWFFGIPLACVALTDSAAAISLLLLNIGRGLFSRIRKSFCTRAGVIICFAALLGGPIGQSSYVMGIALAGPASALLLSSLYPIVGCLLASFWLKQPITKRMWIGICLSVVGGILVGYSPGQSLSDTFYMGVIFSLLAALCWGSESVVAVYGMQHILPDIAITIRECVSAITLWVAILPFVRGYTAIPSICSEKEALLFFLFAGIAAGISYLLWYRANNTIGCAKGMATNITYIIWGCLMTYIWGDSSEITVSMLIGCTCVIIGVLLVTVNPSELIEKTKE